MTDDTPTADARQDVQDALNTLERAGWRVSKYDADTDPFTPLEVTLTAVYRDDVGATDD